MRPERYFRSWRSIGALLWCSAYAGLHATTALAAGTTPPPATSSSDMATGADRAIPEDRRLIELGPGDQITLEVYGQPDMNSTLYVSNDGTISVPLAGPVQVAGVTPVVAAKRVEEALRNGQFLVDPHVTIAVLVGKSQRVSVLGEVHTPGRYVIDPNTSIFDLLAQAGGTTENSADVIYVLRQDAAGNVKRYPINLKALGDRTTSKSATTLQSGDEILVPRAEQFYIYGEVNTPNKYRIEPGMTVIQAIARAGGITPRGSDRRVDIRRIGKDGKYVIIHARPGDLLQPDDVIRVKESIF